MKKFITNNEIFHCFFMPPKKRSKRSSDTLAKKHYGATCLCKYGNNFKTGMLIAIYSIVLKIEI